MANMVSIQSNLRVFKADSGRIQSQNFVSIIAIKNLFYFNKNGPLLGGRRHLKVALINYSEATIKNLYLF